MTIDDTGRTLILEDGRKLGYAQYGGPEGTPVFHFNGSGGSRLERPPDVSMFSDLGISFISTDRPGHGLSDPFPGRRLLDWPGDISQLADHLGIQKFYVEGLSAGGPHALACAYQLPERVLAGAIISGLAPPNRPEPYTGLPFPNRVLMIFARRMPSLVYLLRRLSYGLIGDDPEKVSKNVASFFPPEDRQIVEIPENKAMLVPALQEGYRQGWHGPAQDDILINSPWGFRLEDVKVRIDIWQGEVDKNVPLNQGLYQHEKIHYSRLTVLPGKAHMYLLEIWDEILAQLVA
jgi:pimeloyl-ACP methyl ester carboxylesterase